MSNSEYSIQSVHRKITEDKNKALNILENHGKLFQDLIDKMPEDTITRVNVDSVSLDISLAGDKHEFAMIVRALRTSGFVLDNAMPKAGDASWCAWARHPDGAVMVCFFSSRVCRRVKVGTKMVEQDVYETVCDEIIPPTLSVVQS